MLEQLRQRLQAFLGRIDLNKYEMIFLHVERLGAVGVIIFMAAGLIHYRDNIMPFVPALALVIGYMALFSGFALALVVGLGTWNAAREAFDRTWFGDLLGLSTLAASILLTVGGMYFVAFTCQSSSAPRSGATTTARSWSDGDPAVRGRSEYAPFIGRFDPKLPHRPGCRSALTAAHSTSIERDHLLVTQGR